MTCKTAPPIQRTVRVTRSSSANHVAELPLPSTQPGQEDRLVFRRGSGVENGIR